MIHSTDEKTDNTSQKAATHMLPQYPRHILLCISKYILQTDFPASGNGIKTVQTSFSVATTQTASASL